MLKQKEYERFRQIKARYLVKFNKAEGKKQLDKLKGDFLEDLVRLAFERLGYSIRRHPNTTLDFLAYNKKLELSIEVTNWKDLSYPHPDYTSSKLEAFKLVKTTNLWIVSFLKVLEFTKEEVKELAKTHNLYFVELDKDLDLQNCSYDEYLDIKTRIKNKLKEKHT